MVSRSPVTSDAKSAASSAITGNGLPYITSKATPPDVVATLQAVLNLARA